jgi:tRNA dimethylallyltransferase
MKNNLLAVIVGPTAVGKTELSLEVAKSLDAEIISADSMQIYKYMDIGTAKPSVDELKTVKHYMIDIVTPDQEFSVSDFQTMAKEHIKDIQSRDKIPILTGGTGLYVNSVCYNYTFSEFDKDEKLREELRTQAEKYGNMYLYEKLVKLDPVGAKKIHPNNLRRVIRALEVCIKTGNPFSYYEAKTKQQASPYNLIMFGLTRPRAELYSRISRRTEYMIESGLIEEVKNLLSMGYSRDLNSMQGLGYRQVIEYLDGKLTKDEMLSLIARDTRRYAKRQYTWFLRDKNITWFDLSAYKKEEIIFFIVKVLKENHKMSRI